MKSSEEAILEIFRRLDPATPRFLEGRSPEEVLDLRDFSGFDQAAVAQFTPIDARVREIAREPEIKAARERAFKAVYAKYGSPELAGAVSEDLAFLVACARESRISGWTRAVLAGYAEGRFPTGALPEPEATVDAILAPFRL